MTIAYICILIAAILPYFFVGYAKFCTKGYDNSKPREFLETIGDKGKRANFAHINSFEAFPAFAISIILAQVASVSYDLISTLAIIFIICRILYGVLYIQNQATLRSLVWFVGFSCVVSLFIAAILKS